jgi:DNA-directed RNA polymerase subunit F
LSSPTRIKAEKVILITNSEALKILEEYHKHEKETTGTVSLLVQRVLDYLRKFSKIPPEKVEELREKLVSMGLKEESIIMIMNVCPGTIDELRTLLVLEEKVLESEQLEKIVNLLKEYCVEKQ